MHMYWLKFFCQTFSVLFQTGCFKLNFCFCALLIYFYTLVSLFVNKLVDNDDEVIFTAFAGQKLFSVLFHAPFLPNPAGPPITCAAGIQRWSCDITPGFPPGTSISPGTRPARWVRPGRLAVARQGGSVGWGWGGHVTRPGLRHALPPPRCVEDSAEGLSSPFAGIFCAPADCLANAMKLVNSVRNKKLSKKISGIHKCDLNTPWMSVNACVDKWERHISALGKFRHCIVISIGSLRRNKTNSLLTKYENVHHLRWFSLLDKTNKCPWHSSMMSNDQDHSTPFFVHFKTNEIQFKKDKIQFRTS